MTHKRLLGTMILIFCTLGVRTPPVRGANAFAMEEREVILPSECLVLRPAGQHGRIPVHLDDIEYQLVTGKWKAPVAGEAVTLTDGTNAAWQTLRAGKDGAFEHESLKGGYAFFALARGKSPIMLLEATGHTMVYVNGVPRAGDPYQTGHVRLPVALREKDNTLLFHVTRGKLKVRLVQPRAAAFLDPSDTTLPDLIRGEDSAVLGSIVVVNAAKEDLSDLLIRTIAVSPDRKVRADTPVPGIPPVGLRKVAFAASPVQATDGRAKYTLQLMRNRKSRQEVLDQTTIELRVRGPDQTHKRTFLSEIDGSVQYYAVNPARPATSSPRRPALFLTLHGAGVEALGQAEAYSPKAWGHLVAPTNRRPYGFDWEDWGRLDALEVLDRAQKHLGTDPRRTYLTGHSMGGHGTWHVGANAPDRFAAIGPSAGWITMWTYAGAPRSQTPSPMVAMLERATNPSDAFALCRNYLHHGLYVLHGSADDNVPVDQARLMRDHLSALLHDFVYHEQPGAGHWWDLSDEPGTDCVDWAPMFDYFAHHVIPDDDSVREVDFTTASPGVLSQSHWATIEDQIRPGRFSSVQIRLDPGLRRFSGKTKNVARLMLDLRSLSPGAAIRVELDGEKLGEVPWPASQPRIWLARTKERGWHLLSPPSRSSKGPHRYGPFKEAFRNRMQFVYGTHGTSEENGWAFAKARFDAETFWYRGNGSIDVISDREFLLHHPVAVASGVVDPTADRDRNVILYGNAATNSAWKSLLADSPVQVQRGRVQFGKLEEKGDDLACLFVRPRPDSDRALVGVIAGTGISGMKLTERLPYFVSGVGYPDLIIMSADVLKRGINGIRWAGFFGSDWSLTEGEFVRNKGDGVKRPDK